MPHTASLRVLFPLWAKLGLVFGGLAASLIAAALWLDHNDQLAVERRAQQVMIEGLAQTLAYQIDGDVHRSFTTPKAMKRPDYRHLAQWMRVATNGAEVGWIGTSKRDRKGRWSYVIDSGVEAPFPVGYPIFDGIKERNHAWEEGEVIYVFGLEDEWGRWDTAYAPIRTSGGVVVGIVEVAVDAELRDFRNAEDTQRIINTILIGGLLSLLSAILFARWINRHLLTLTDTALAVADGDLERNVHIPSWDEIGVLGRAFNRMTHGLRERDRIRGAFGRFVSDDVAERALADPDGMVLGGESRQVTVVMSDLRGFTSLSEQLGPTNMVELLNRYFTAMSGPIAKRDGNIAELLGDGMVLFFGAPNLGPHDARNAIKAAIGMQQALVSFCATEGRDLEMGIGIDTGNVVAGNIGSEKRMKYGVVGDAINLAARLEGFTIGNQVLISDATRVACGDDGLVIGGPMDLMAKGRSEPIRCYPVLACDDMKMPEGEVIPAIDVALPGQCWRIIGKQVEVAPHECVIVRVQGRSLTLHTALALDVWDKIKLGASVDGTEITDVYGTVTALVEGGFEIRATSVTDEARIVLDALIAKA